MKIRYIIILTMGVRVFVVLMCCTFLIGGNFVVGKIWFRRTANETQVKEAISQAEDVNAIDEQGYTGLMFAAVSNDPVLARALTAAGANTNIQTKKQYDNTALHFALLGGDQTIRIADLLLNNNANLLLRNSSFGATPLLNSYAIIDNEKRLAMMQRLIKHGGDLNAQYTVDGNTFMHVMVEDRELPFIQMMLDYFGSLLDLSIKNNKGYTAYEWAQSFLYTEVTNALAVQPKKIRKPGERDKNGLTALMIAVMRNNSAEIQRLLKDGADINAQSDDQFDFTPLDFAVLYERLPLVQLLMDKKADALKTDARGRIPLMHITRIVQPKKRIVFAKQLLTIKPEEQLNHQDQMGNTILFSAVFAGDRELLSYLLDNFQDKIDATIKNNALITAYGLANKLRHYDLAKMLKPLTLKKV